MDVNIFRSALTVVALLAFAGIVFWAYSGRSKKQFEQAALSVLREEHVDGSEGTKL